MEGIRRVHGKPKKKAKALRLEHVATLLSFYYQSLRPKSKSASITTGPIFRAVNRWDQLSDSAMTLGVINLWLKSLALLCEFNFTPELSRHSFRRGLPTSAAREKIAFELIKKQGGMEE